MNEINTSSKKSGTVYCINCCDKKLQESNTALKTPNNRNTITLFKSQDKLVSLLAIENITKQKDCSRLQKENYEFKSCDFGENITTEGFDLSKLRIGEKIKIGTQVILQIYKTGKNCYKYCDLYNKILGCIISKEFIFCKVINEGNVNIGDEIKII